MLREDGQWWRRLFHLSHGCESFFLVISI